MRGALLLRSGRQGPPRDHRFPPYLGRKTSARRHGQGKQCGSLRRRTASSTTRRKVAGAGKWLNYAIPDRDEWVATRSDSLPWLFVSERQSKLSRFAVNYLVEPNSEARWLPQSPSSLLAP